MTNFHQLYIGDSYDDAWNICRVNDEKDEPTNFIAIRGEMEGDEAHALFKKLVVEEGRKVIGLSSYQNFPKRTCNPHQNDCYPAAKDELFINQYGHHVIMWCHCFRNPLEFLPTQSIPLLLFSESDQYGYENDLFNTTSQEFQYDFFASVPDGEWNAWIRNLDICKRWLNYMADEMNMKILVCGTDRRADFSGKIDVVDFLPWDQFITAMNKCKYLFNATGHDASPRILIEALALNKPVLVNENVVGGWKYINAFTGDFFCPTEQIKPKIQQFLSETVPKCLPRQWLNNHFRPEDNKRHLAQAVNIITSLKWSDVVDAVIYINLDNRPDRLQELLNEFMRYDIAPELQHRISATEEVKCGHLGCVKSHLQAIAYALEHGYERVLILEDDFQFKLAKERVLYMLHEFYNDKNVVLPVDDFVKDVVEDFVEDQTVVKDDTKGWDVLMFANGYYEYTDPTNLHFIQRLNYCTTMAGYLVNGSAYLKKLQQNFQESRDLITAELSDLHIGDSDHPAKLYETFNACDQHWLKLQTNDRFYTFNPTIGTQSGSPSSTMA